MKLSDHNHGVGQFLPDHVSVRLYVVQRQVIGAAWDSQDVVSSFWRLYVNNRDGAELVLADGERYPLLADRLHLVPAWMPFSCANDREILHHFCHFDLVGLMGSAVRAVFDRPLTLPAGSGLETMFCELGDRLQDPDWPRLSLDCQAKGLVLQALALMFADLSEADLARCQLSIEAQSRFEPALAYIDQNLDGAVRNEDLARLCSMSEDHFIRRFRDELGQTPNQYVIERRVAYAAQLLLHGDASIERVAARAGFANRHYFSRVFARRMGMPPAEYRRHGQP